MKKILILLTLINSVLAFGQTISPLPVTADTIALWNFNNDSGDVVPDSASNPLDGTAFSTELLAIPGITNNFLTARKFTAASSFIDLGPVTGTKLDFTGASEFSIEAVIYLTASAPNNHIIFNTENVRLMVVNNKLGLFIRQPGGLFGVISEQSLNPGTIYRVAGSYVDNFLTVFVNERTVGQVKMNNPISAPAFSTSRAYIGGDIFGKFLPGYIDDVRVSAKNLFDIKVPTVTLIAPTFVVDNSRPEFDIQYADVGTGIDLSSVKVYLNGILQPGIPRTLTGINGQMDDHLTPGVNEVKIIVSDNVGNTTTQVYLFSFANILSRTEYDSDQDTLALWHMNEFASGILGDSSSHNTSGYGDSRFLSTGEGIFSRARYFNGSTPSKISVESIKIPGQAFTIEAWIKPTANNTVEEIIFHSGQVKVSRFNGGYLRVTFYTVRNGHVYESTDALMPIGETHHIAVSWDGTLSEKNLTFFRDGAPIQIYNEPADCDFDPIPNTGIIGQFFIGMIDELRFSSVARTGFNIPLLDAQAITFHSLSNGTSVNNSFPELHVSIDSGASIDPAKIKVILNGQQELPTAQLTITAQGIDGIMSHALTQGLNTIEVQFIDSRGNQKKKEQFFFYIKENGGHRLLAGSDTVALWHFDQSDASVMLDESGKQNNLIGTTTTVEGVIGSGRKGTAQLPSNTIQIRSKSYTFEGFFKKNINDTINGLRPLYSLTSTDLTQIVYLNPSNGDVRIYFSHTDASLDRTIAAAFPNDNQFHHLAVSFDSNRAFSELVVMIDGEVKQSYDVKCACKLNSPFNFSMADSEISFDEVRISNSAHYAYDTIKTNKPFVLSSSTTDGETVHSSTLAINYLLGDNQGIAESGTLLKVNGVTQSGLTFNSSGTQASLTGNVSLIPGANIIELVIRNADGNEQVQNHVVYYFAKGGSTPYVGDSDTLFLLHMDDVSGTVLSDDSGNGNHFDVDPGWTFGEVGVFGTNAVKAFSSYGRKSGINLNGLQNYSMEGWVKPTNNNYADLFRYISMTFSLNNGRLTYITPSGKNISSSIVIPAVDEIYHHLALVVDSAHPNRNVYLLLDGAVVVSAKEVASVLAFAGTSGLNLGPTMYNNPVDEFRFSTIPRYTLNYSQSKKITKTIKKSSKK